MMLRLLLLCFALAAPALVQGASPVWKVTGPQGGTLYLGGSIHALRSAKDTLPRAFDQALEQSTHIVFENDEAKRPQQLESGEYPKGDNLKNHVDPRTYAYVKRIFALLGVPEEQMAKYRPWALTLMLWSPGLQGLSPELGVESRLKKRARASGKSISGLVSAREHNAVFSGLSDRQSEAVLLLTFIPTASTSYENVLNAWRRGDVEVLWRQTHTGFAEYPAFGERILEARNRTWIPKIEGYLRSGRTYFVVVGSAHLGGPEGLLALLRERGFRLEQL